MTPKTIFLSHRRSDTGKLFARQLQQALTNQGCDCFLDVDGIGSGPWADQLQEEVKSRAHFLLLLTPGDLADCVDSGDWVRREYELAVDSDRNIVPVLSDTFNLDKEKEACPVSMRGVFKLQMATVSHEGAEQDIKDLIERYIVPAASGGASLPSKTPTPHNLPTRNLLFTGREQLLTDLHQQLADTRMAELQGLGGMGKTSTALEYAHRHLAAYPFVGWLRAEDPLALAEEFVSLAPLLGVAVDGIKKRETAVDMVRHGFNQVGGGLVIFDNLEDRAAIEPYLPPGNWPGHVILTARDVTASSSHRPLSPAEFTLEEAAKFLAAHLEPDNPESLAGLLTELGGLPLALEQARGYMQASGRKVGAYLQLFRDKRSLLLAYTVPAGRHQQTVATTWTLAFEQVAAEYPESAALLNICAFLALEAIPYHLFTTGSAQLPPELADRVQDEMAFDELIMALRRHGLLQSETKGFSFHRLVQVVLYERLPVAERTDWLNRAIALLAAAFLFDDRDLQTWTPSAQLISHVHAIWEQAQASDYQDEELARLLNHAGWYLSTRAEYTDSRKFLAASLAIRQTLHGDEHVATAASLSDMAFLLKQLGQYQQAESHYRRALDIYQSLFGEDDAATATSLNNLADVLRAQGKYKEAQPLFEQALAITKSAFGDAHPDTATSLNNLAGVLRAQGQYQQARPLYEQALAITKSVFGDAHPDTAASLNNLALVLQEQGQYKEAQPLYEQALAIHQSAFGDAHPETATSLNNLAEVLRVQGKYQQTQPLYERALGIIKSLFGDNHPDTAKSLSGLASVLQDKGKYQQAQPLYEQALAINKSHFGDAHPCTAASLNNLGTLLFYEGQARAAIPYLEQSLAAHYAVFPAGHPNILKILFDLGQACAQILQFAKAREYLLLALRTREEHPEYTDVSVQAINQLLNSFSHGRGKSNKKDKKKTGKQVGKNKNVEKINGVSKNSEVAFERRRGSATSKVSSLSIRGFKSIRELRDFPMGDLNVLIGANGAGKSNFIGLFRLLNEMLERRLQLFFQQQGGPDVLLHYGRQETSHIGADFYFGSDSYAFDLMPTAYNTLIFQYEKWGGEGIYSGGALPYVVFGPGHSESKLSDAKGENFSCVRESIRQWRVWHFHDAGEKAKVKQRHQANDNLLLRSDAANLAAYLRMLHQEHGAAYERIIDTIRLVAPFFGDFVHRLGESDTVELEWMQEGRSDKPFKAHVLSDGTLRFICLATLLLQPVERLPNTILIDEPELGLHPYAVSVLAEMLKQVSEDRQLIISTQSVELVNELSPEDIIVVDHEDGASTFRRFEEEELAGWLEDYALGDLWERNVLGGRP